MVDAAAGLAFAFEAFYSTNWAHAYAFAFKTLRNREDAEDVCVDAFAIASKTWGEFTSDHARNRLLLLVRWRCLDVLRLSSRAKTDSLDEPRAGSGSDSSEGDLFVELSDLPDQLNSLLQAELITAIDAMIKALTPRQSTAIRMKMNDFSTEEIASAMGIGTEGVLGYICLARKRIKERILKEGLWPR